MKALLAILLSALAALWIHFAVAVAPRASPPPSPLAAEQDELSAASLNNKGVAASRAGRSADALAFFERARDFRPDDPVIARNLEATRARIERTAWLRVLVAGSVALAGLGLLGAVRAARAAGQLARIRLRGEPFVRVEPGARRVELPLSFNEPVGRFLARHPLTVVWSSAVHGKHMKSRPPARAREREVTVALEGERLDRLRRHPGDWKGFLYLGRTPVGAAALRVG
ncbi:MAG: hypothetical protein ACT4PV_02575 [Planctomycetaceae bacterium]